MLTGVSVTCFLLSYVIVFGLEVSRYFVRIPGRNLLLIGMQSAGLAAHSIFLINELMRGLSDSSPQLLTSWFQWSVLGAWGLAVACLVLIVRNPNGSISLFLIPVILALLGLAQLLKDQPPFGPDTTASLWKSIHGVSLLMGTMFICFGLAFGVMYLLKSLGLKSKRRRGLFKLPALEFLQSMNRFSLFATTVSLAVGVVSGVVLSQSLNGRIDWFSGSIVFTLAMFALSLIATITELSSTGSLGGRQSAYLVIANFLFFAVVLGLVLFSSHGQLEEEKEISPSAWKWEVMR